MKEGTFCDEFLNLDLRLAENCKPACEGMDWVFNLAADMGGMGFIQSNHSRILYNSTMISFNVHHAPPSATPVTVASPPSHPHPLRHHAGDAGHTRPDARLSQSPPPSPSPHARSALSDLCTTCALQHQSPRRRPVTGCRGGACRGRQALLVCVLGLHLPGAQAAHRGPRRRERAQGGRRVARAAAGSSGCGHLPPRITSQRQCPRDRPASCLAATSLPLRRRRRRRRRRPVTIFLCGEPATRLARLHAPPTHSTSTACRTLSAGRLRPREADDRGAAHAL